MGAYRDVLEPPVSKCDVTYWLNAIAQNQTSRNGKRVAAINTAGTQSDTRIVHTLSHPSHHSHVLINVLLFDS